MSIQKKSLISALKTTKKANVASVPTEGLKGEKQASMGTKGGIKFGTKGGIKFGTKGGIKFGTKGGIKFGTKGGIKFGGLKTPHNS
jgi:hypothetical protein